MSLPKMMFDRMLVTRISDEKSEGGILLPDETKRKSNEGKVVAVGPGRWFEGKHIPVQPKVGDTIRFGSATAFFYKGEDYLVVDERSVIAIM